MHLRVCNLSARAIYKFALVCVYTFACVRGLDAIEVSPIIDVKLYVPRANSIPEGRIPT